MSGYDDLTFDLLDVHATDEDSVARLHAYADTWSQAFHEGRLDEEKNKHWIEHSRVDDVTLRAVLPRRSAIGGTPRPVATFTSWDQQLNVGGPDLLPVRMITDVTVAPTHRRRGLLTRLMTEDLDEAVRAGVPLAALTVSEGSIYGRYGFGPATRYRKVHVDVRPGRFALHHLEDDGTLELALPAEAWPAMAQVHAERLATSRGEIARPAFYEQFLSGRFDWESGGPDRKLTVVVHLDVTGQPDGYVAYRTAWKDDQARLEVADLVATTHTAHLRLWRHVADVDLVTEVRARTAPDDLLDLAVVDPRGVTSVEVRDFLWLRILDLPRALEARPWREDASVVLEVDDALGHTAGRWRVTTEKGTARVARTDDEPSVRLPADVLAALYLGDRSVLTAAAAGRLHGPDVTTLAAMADHAGPAPYCSTGF
ncbi:Enhanced intracellular survival protein [Nocardioides dokdonensis FR1436]|uniref:Enhanced intracellular survival protein n=1 Tax=Nocardioides dokdonensis FR1436 TaxID=1300347 RepID=A0A1A9GEW5_9ACTN|nr:GNAT family N-acetyltransferase [Nocardioides dokdonensis]ANH36827.1 Enhanced intracellular survival protein [Nocardioides dokdonensis FR1436]